MTILKPLSDNILFVWLDSLHKEYTLPSGIILQRTLSKQRQRWGQIIAVGPNSTAKVGEYVLPDSHVEPYGAKHPDIENQELRNETTDIWRIRDENVFCVTSDYTLTQPMNSDYVHTKIQNWETL